MPRTNEEKFRTVIEKNTYYYFNARFEESYEGHINALRETLLVLKNDVETNGLRKESLERLLAESENGLPALLALTGFSNESLKRIITLIRVVTNPELDRLSLKRDWYREEDLENLTEWSDTTMQKKVHTNAYFRRGIVNLFFEGATVPFLAQTIPLFELKKLSITKLNFDVVAMIDTLIRYKVKGSYAGQKENNAEAIIAEIITDLGLEYEHGDLSELISNEQTLKRTMDFIIPNKRNPLVIVESSFLVTTSSGQGDKSKTEINVRDLLTRHYPRAKFFGFIDGIGWYVRKKDLRRMVEAYKDVYTLRNDELSRFRSMLISEFNL